MSIQNEMVTITRKEYMELLACKEIADRQRAKGATTWAKMTPEEKTARALKMVQAKTLKKQQQAEEAVKNEFN